MRQPNPPQLTDQPQPPSNANANPNPNPIGRAATKQFALTLRTDSAVRRKIALLARIDNTLVAEAELDEIPGIYTLAFAPNDPRLVDLSSGRVPQLSLMWKHRSFNLLLNQQSELHLTGLELSQLDSDDERQPIVRYVAGSGGPQVGSSLTSSLSSSSAASGGSQATASALKSSAGADLALTRNQWHRFEGRIVRPEASA